MTTAGRRELNSKGAVLKRLILITAMIASAGGMLMPWETANSAPLPYQTPSAQAPIKVTIETARNALSSLTNRFRIGDEILVPITMTNTSTHPVSVCISSDLYQDLPTLRKSGEHVSIMSWQSEVRQGAQRDDTCKEINLSEDVILNPNEPKMVDWLVLVDSKVSTGAEAWYDPLPPGQYELSIQRRLGCCDGPRMQSNKISFEVLP